MIGDPMRRCILCREPLAGNRASEHVLPRWLEREIGGGAMYFGHSIEGDTGTSFTISSSDTIAGTASTRVEGRICRSCNNIWLSSLEETAKPVISDMVFGRRTVQSLPDRERLLLATWLYKTLLFGVSSGSGEFGIHACDFHHFRATRSPGGWLNIYAAVLETTCPGFCGPLEMKWPQPINCESEIGNPDVSDLGLKWVFHIGRLHVAACHTALNGASQVVLKDLHFPVWTPQSYMTEPNGLAPEVGDDSLLLLLAYGLTPTLRLLTK